MRIGINAAVQAIRCDIWAFYDKVIENEYDPIGDPCVITAIAPRREDDTDLQHSFCGFGSIGLAISIAWMLGAKVINVYGADWHGHDHIIRNARLDKIGYTDPPGRWELESEKFGLLQKELQKVWYGRHPTELNRIMADV